MPALSSRLVISSGPGIPSDKNAAAFGVDLFLGPIRILPAQASLFELPSSPVKFLRDFKTAGRSHAPDELILQLLGLSQMSKLPPLVSCGALRRTGAKI